MATKTDTGRTAHLLALMKEGDDGFNDRRLTPVSVGMGRAEAPPT
jgi:hypothetical protein